MIHAVLGKLRTEQRCRSRRHQLDCQNLAIGKRIQRGITQPRGLFHCIYGNIINRPVRGQCGHHVKATIPRRWP